MDAAGLADRRVVAGDLQGGEWIGGIGGVTVGDQPVVLVGNEDSGVPRVKLAQPSGGGVLVCGEQGGPSRDGVKATVAPHQEIAIRVLVANNVWQYIVVAGGGHIRLDHAGKRIHREQVAVGQHVERHVAEMERDGREVQLQGSVSWEEYVGRVRLQPRGVLTADVVLGNTPNGIDRLPPHHRIVDHGRSGGSRAGYGNVVCMPLEQVDRTDERVADAHRAAAEIVEIGAGGRIGLVVDDPRVGALENQRSGLVEYPQRGVGTHQAVGVVDVEGDRVN